MNLRHESGYPVFTSIEEPKFVITQQLNGAEVRE